jgi:L-alanine-DL-glutamate epimerase-like enolase superfamily enzyme
MKITGIEFRAYRTSRPRPIRNGRLTYPDATTCVAEVRTDEGLSGTGLGVGVLLPGGERVIASLVEMYAGLLTGMDPLDNERAWATMWQPKLVGRRGVETRAQSLIDIALWDIKGKAAGLPLYKLLGGYRTSVPCYVAGGYYEEGKSLGALAEEMRGYLDDGIRAVKMKVGGAPVQEDIKRLAAVRQEIGAEPELLVDANGAYDAGQAVRMAREMENFDVYWFEEPVMPDDYDSSRIVADASSIPVASGENESTRFGFRDLLDRGGVRIINPDAEILGGITEFMKVAALAEARGVPVAPHGRADIHVHLVAAIPNGLMVEYYRENVDPLARYLLPERLTVSGGRLTPPDRPGHGMVLDEQAAEVFRVV